MKILLSLAAILFGLNFILFPLLGIIVGRLKIRRLRHAWKESEGTTAPGVRQ